MPGSAQSRLTVYIAARTDRADELSVRASELAELGIEVIGSWLRSPRGLDPVADPSAAADAAAIGLAEVREADVFVAVNEGVGAPRFGRGGRHVEFGAALALGKRILVVGPVEHIFHVVRGVVVCDNWSSAVGILTAWLHEKT